MAYIRPQLRQGIQLQGTLLGLCPLSSAEQSHVSL